MKPDIDTILGPLAEQFDGFFISRIKGLESFAQKIETGQAWKPNEIIDLYAATIVVPTFKEMEKIEVLLKTDFKVLKTFSNRNKKPTDFIYDDKHVHLQYKHQVTPGKEYLAKRFELQIKTFLQHGWAKATHDILYKGDQLEWPRFRVAAQIKAMLEQSDQILFAIDKSSLLCEDNGLNEYKDQNVLIKIMKDKWDVSQLPSNIRGTAQAVYDLLCISNQPMAKLVELIELGCHADLVDSKSLTPHQAFLGILIRLDVDSLREGLKRANKKIFISNELKDLLGIIPGDILAMSIKV
ncbi:MAG: hypothetical protein V1747_03210 [Candidatus Omnitrophota bacterium]